MKTHQKQIKLRKHFWKMNATIRRTKTIASWEDAWALPALLRFLHPPRRGVFASAPVLTIIIVWIKTFQHFQNIFALQMNLKGLHPCSPRASSLRLLHPVFSALRLLPLIRFPILNFLSSSVNVWNSMKLTEPESKINISRRTSLVLSSYVCKCG